MTVATQLEILDLRHFSARQLRPLLETEAREWQERLRWNYQSSTELLLQYLDSRILPGFVALDRGRICGFAFCVYEGHKAVVGDAYAMANEPDQVLPSAELSFTICSSSCSTRPVFIASSRNSSSTTPAPSTKPSSPPASPCIPAS